MKYRYEAIQNGEIVLSGVIETSNRYHILRIITSKLNDVAIDVLMLNENAIFYNFVLEKKNGKYKPFLLSRKTLGVSHPMLMKLFSGSRTLKSLGLN